MMWGMGSGVGMIAMVALWVFIIAVIVRAFGAADRRAFPGGHRETPLDILQRRYASGDIGRDEYEQKRRDLDGPVRNDEANR